ncbi:MAG: class I tRNA ligase family protein, partial [Pseudohongiellaceae bacterium]
EYCDWYLELSKPVLMTDSASEAARRGTRRTLVRQLEAVLRLAHPIMPYITEEIWQRIGPLAGRQGDTIMTRPYPEADSSKIDNAAVQEMEWVKQFIVAIRQIRSGMDIKPGKPLPVILQHFSNEDRARVESNLHYLQNLARIESIDWLNNDQQAPESATALVGEMQILIPMAGLIDKEAELARLSKEIDKLEKDVQRVDGKLNNKSFVDKAPEAVVQKERDKLKDMQGSLQQLKGQKDKIARL